MRSVTIRRLVLCAALLGPLGPGRALAASGHVVDPEGKPVPGARACLLIAGADGLCSVTDEAGYYGLPDTSAPFVRITAPGFLPKQISAVEQEVPVALDRAATILVRLLDRASGAGIQGKVFVIDSTGKKRGPLPANAAGVRLSTLEPGEIVLLGTAPGHADARSETIRLQGGDDREIVLKLDATGSGS
jgi:hypothetical protein